MLDCQLYGLNPGRHHQTNLFFHIASTLLLFLCLRRLTGVLWRSGFVAALFALHPLHVESVAWIAERKDVLSTFFWMLTMWGYIRYVERPGIAKYLSVLLFFILGLLSKPILVTLPFVLLLLDYWPLGRFQAEQSVDKSKQLPGSLPLHLFWEKIPFFVLAAASSIVTFLVQQRGGAVGSLDVFPLNVRIANALVSYVRYLGKIIWPNNLSVFYPHPGMLSGWQVAGACLLLAAISLLAVRSLKRSPYVAVGWLWYVGSLVPVIGLVQVGGQSMADRYSYVPLIGIFIIIAWGVPELVQRWHYKNIGLSTMSAALLLILMITTWLQVRYWANTITLFEHALKINVNNYVAHNNLGLALAKQGNTVEAISHYTEALRINPDYVKAHNRLGIVLARGGKIESAIVHFQEALRIKPDHAEARYNLKKVLSVQRKTKNIPEELGQVD